MRATTNIVGIGLGEVSVLNEHGILSSAVTGGKETAINMRNNYKEIHPGVNQLSTGLDGREVSTPIYVADKAVVTGDIELTPKEEVMVWFEQNIETSTMISEERSNPIEIDLTNTNIANVNYKGGKWQKA